MRVTLPKFRVGEPVRHQSLAVYPLFSETGSCVDYRLAQAALADKSLLVGEVDEDGSVPELLVENKGDLRVLFLEGEELIGAKQNRILNMSILVAAHSKTKIPVSCVEQGRWGYKTRHFGPSGSYSPSKLRRALKASVSRSVKEKLGHHSDQGEVWEAVSALHATHGVESETAAMSDAFDAHQDKIAAYREHLQYVEGAVGLAVAIGNQINSIDVFDKPSTCESAWDKLLSGVVFDALEADKEHEPASIADVEQLLAATERLPWEQADPIGEGEEFRAESQRGDHASALTFGETLVHGSVVTVG